MQEEQMNLYAKAGVNPMANCLPMVITMVILFALIPVIYGPLTYVSNADKEELTDSNNMISNLYVVSAEVKSKDTTIEKLIEKFEKDGATEDEAYDKLEKLLQTRTSIQSLQRHFLMTTRYRTLWMLLRLIMI